MYIHVYTYRKRARYVDRLTDRQTDRETDRLIAYNHHNYLVHVHVQPDEVRVTLLSRSTKHRRIVNEDEVTTS